MLSHWKSWFTNLRPQGYGRRSSLVLINGLAEQAESWFRNDWYWRRTFDVHVPNILAYRGAALHRRIDSGLPVSVDYLVEQLHMYLDSFVQSPPYHLVAASLGGKVAIEYAVRYPDEVDALVLLCPSGLGEEEKLPVIEGLRRSDTRGLVASIFHNERQVDERMLGFFKGRFSDRLWRAGLLRTIRGTMGHCVRSRLPQVAQPTLLISGREDRIVDQHLAAEAAELLPNCRYVSIPRCGHAPQMERAGFINRLVAHFLHAHSSATNPTVPVASLPQEA